jgi:uncharacterized protein (DUF2141 family)
MRHYLVAAATSLTLAASCLNAAAAPTGTLRHAVQVYYQANNRVQLAVYRDACLHWDMFKENRTARARLSRVNARSYDAIGKLLGDAYSAVAEPTDGNLEQVRLDFCNAADNR